MNLNLNIDNYGGKSIVPVMCSDKCGTGFYVGNKCFLTAWHLVSEAKDDNADILVKIDGVDVVCKLIELGEMDAALIICQEPVNETIIKPIQLLNTDFKKELDLEIIGYPQEIGNGVDYFGICVKNLRKLSDHSKGFDIIVQRTDALGFYSYSGFSGSPVLNEAGYAVGIVTDQLHNTLGYTSINSIVAELDAKNISYENNADEQDTTPYGLGTCIRLVNESLKRVTSRYNKDLHIEDQGLIEHINAFCGYGVKEFKETVRLKFCTWYQHLPKAYLTVVESFAAFQQFMTSGEIGDAFYSDLEAISNLPEPKHPETYFIRGKQRSDFLKLIDEISVMQEKVMISKQKFLYVKGDAGCGKTHHLCHLAERLCHNINIYVLFGTDFRAEEDPLRTISIVLGWDSYRALDELNEEMKKKGRYATFILDALNEGAGTFFWKDLLPQLIAHFDRLKNLKLIVSVRNMEKDDELKVFFSSWEHYEINGFSDVKTAIKKYFTEYGIEESPDDYMRIREFIRPLFLKIFCNAYFSLPYDMRKDIDLHLLYRMYFYNRNNEVSHNVEEDPQRNVTSRLVYSLGERSLLTYQCGDVPRDKAIAIANKICHYRTWPKNLYHNMLKANLLMEYNTRQGKGMTTFEYDSMGDFVRADKIIALNKTDEECFKYIKRMAQRRLEPQIDSRKSARMFNTIKAFLAIWNPNPTYWSRSEFKNGILTAMFIESLDYRNVQSKVSTVSNEVIAEIVQHNDIFLSPRFVFQKFVLYKNHLINHFHDKLMRMSMTERDERWTINVNQMFDKHSLEFTISNVDIRTEEDIETYTQMLSWLLTASHPQLRCKVIRMIRQYMSKYPQLCQKLIDLFHEANDPYILQGIYAATYGAILLSRDKVLAKKIAKMIYDLHYKESKNVPKEITVRLWTLKILEFNATLNKDDRYWELSQPPYEQTDNLMFFPKDENFSSDNYFGNGWGALSLYTSLFEGDFNRYIIGTNSNSESHTYIKNGVNISLDDMTKAVAFRIKHKYKYSEKLSCYDDNVHNINRMTHLKERIGKKYQWIALGEVKAYLSDTCQMSINWWNKRIAEKPYPWYDSIKETFDPTLNIYDNTNSIDVDMFEEIPEEDLFKLDNMEWIESREQLPRLNIVIKDKNGEEWTVLVGYQTVHQSKNQEERDSFIYYCPCLVNQIDNNIVKFKKWAQDQNFYGRWMPENTGSYEFFWNEYPWSDSYKQIRSEETNEGYRGIPCPIALPYRAQLQENMMAINDEDEISSTVYMPLSDIYKYYNLHNAERGIVRDSGNNIIAINRHIPGDSMNALVIRRRKLDDYLINRKISLFYCCTGEKELLVDSKIINIQRLSTCIEYIPYKEPKVVQPMKDERDFATVTEGNKDESPFEGISDEDWLKIKNTKDDKEFMKRLQKLTLFASKKKENNES